MLKPIIFTRLIIMRMRVFETGNGRWAGLESSCCAVVLMARVKELAPCWSGTAVLDGDFQELSSQQYHGMGGLLHGASYSRRRRGMYQQKSSVLPSDQRIVVAHSVFPSLTSRCRLQGSTSFFSSTQTTCKNVPCSFLRVLLSVFVHAARSCVPQSYCN
jgi:hypothetical protein